VEEGDCLGVSLGDPAAVEGAESTVVEVSVRRRTARAGIEVEAMGVVVFPAQALGPEMSAHLGI
jgi:hypothetical protein